MKNLVRPRYTEVGKLSADKRTKNIFTQSAMDGDASIACSVGGGVQTFQRQRRRRSKAAAAARHAVSRPSHPETSADTTQHHRLVYGLTLPQRTYVLSLGLTLKWSWRILAWYEILPLTQYLRLSAPSVARGTSKNTWRPSQYIVYAIVSYDTERRPLGLDTILVLADLGERWNATAGTASTSSCCRPETSEDSTSSAAIGQRPASIQRHLQPTGTEFKPAGCKVVGPPRGSRRASDEEQGQQTFPQQILRRKTAPWAYL